MESEKEALWKPEGKVGDTKRGPPTQRVKIQTASCEVGLLWLWAHPWKYHWLLWSDLRKKAGCGFLMSLFWCQWGSSLHWDLFLLLLRCLVSAVLGGVCLLTIWRGTFLLFLFRAIMWTGMRYRVPITLKSICGKNLYFERNIGTVGIQSAGTRAALLYDPYWFPTPPFFYWTGYSVILNME